MTADERQRALEEIAAEVRVCTRCRLAEGRTNAVPGEGNPETEVAFVGEGPGFNEDQQGRPFVGAAGGLLTELLGSIGWRRDEVFITNVVKCRPPGNRDPEPDEIAACAPYLHRQLEVLDPALVVSLGRFSLQTFMPGARISSAHGTVRRVEPATGAADADAVALYHPAAAFRQQALRETLAEDVARLPAALLASRERRQSLSDDQLAPVNRTAVPVLAGSAGTVATAARPATATEPGSAAEPTPATEPGSAAEPTPATEAESAAEPTTATEAESAAEPETSHAYPGANEIQALDPAAIEQVPSDDQLRLF